MLNKNYVECITAIQLENQNTLKFISDNWTDGDLELYFNIFLLPRDSSGINMMTKVAIVPQSELDTISRVNSGGRFDSRTPITLKTYTGNPLPIKIDTWDNYKYGNTWKITVYEYDPGGQTTVTTSVSSTYTNNFKGNAGVDIGIVKLGGEYDYTEAKTNSQTISYQTTDASEQLGDILVKYDDNIYTETPTGRNGSPIINSNMVSTGSIKLLIEPKRYN